MFSRYAAEGVLQHVTGRQAIFALPTAYVALFATVPTNGSGAGAAEPPGAGYARIATSAASWGAATTPPSQIANAAAIQFPAALGSWGTLLAAGLYDAASGGDLLFWDWLGNNEWAPATVSAAAPAVVTAPAHGYSVGDNLAFTEVFGGAAPAFSQSNLTGLLTVASVPTVDTFTVTNSGTAVNTSGTGSGFVRKVAPYAPPLGISPTFAPGALVLRIDEEAAAVSGFVLGTGTSGTDALGTGTGASDLFGVQ